MRSLVVLGGAEVNVFIHSRTEGGSEERSG